MGYRQLISSSDNSFSLRLSRLRTLTFPCQVVSDFESKDLFFLESKAIAFLNVQLVQFTSSTVHDNNRFAVTFSFLCIVSSGAFSVVPL